MTDLTQVTVNLTPRAVAALDAACARTGDSRTDTIRRALGTYRIVLDLIDRHGGLVAVLPDGTRERIHLC